MAPKAVLSHWYQLWFPMSLGAQGDSQALQLCQQSCSLGTWCCLSVRGIVLWGFPLLTVTYIQTLKSAFLNSSLAKYFPSQKL